MTNQSEASLQTDVRVEASKRGMRLWRNNSGAVTTDDGRHIRFGLANESRQLNKVLKSSDLIGVTPVTITPDMVGQTIGVFTSIEVKKPGWYYRGQGREVAQKTWIDMVIGLGGIGKFIAKMEDL